MMIRMKTTENISIAGYPFIIESDAYYELEKYLDEVRDSFSSNPSGDEIVADIEERIAELLAEKCPKGMTVNISMVKDIIERIGLPDQLAEEDSRNEDTAAYGESLKECRQNRRLFRNIDERILGGVCAGLGTYFNLDKVIFRLIFMAVFIIGLFEADDALFLIAGLTYICMWIAMPAARTVEEKCSMKGKPMDLKGFGAKDLNLKKELNEVAQSPAVRTFARTGSMLLGSILLIVGISVMIGCIFIPSMPELLSKGIVRVYGTAEDILSIKAAETITMEPVFWHIILVIAGIMGIWAIYNGIMLLFNMKPRTGRPGLILFILWLISIIALCAWTTHFALVNDLFFPIFD